MTKAAPINADMIIMEVIQGYPETLEVFFEYGIGCVGCAMAQYETVADGAGLHGFDIDDLVDDLNSVIE